MPHIIPLTPKQRATLTTLKAEAQQAEQRVNIYTLGILDATPDAPGTFDGITLTDAGLVLGDAPIVAALPDTPPPEAP